MHPGRLFRSLLRSLAAHALIIAIVAPCLGFQLHPQSPSTIFQGRPPHVLRQPPAGCRAALMLAKGDPRGPEHRLEEWLEELGAKTSALRVSDFSDGLRGVAATRDLAKGEVVLSVPLKACIVDDGCAGFPEGWTGVQWQGRAAYRLAVEKKKEVASAWYPYIAMLPADPPRVPARWSKEELADLQDPWLAAEAESLQMWSHELYDDVSHLPPPPGCHGCPLPSKHEFLWALDTLQSRTIRIDRNDGGWEGTELDTPSGGGGWISDEGGSRWVGEGSGSIRVLVPMLDLLNHSPTCETYFSLEEGGLAVQLQIGYAVCEGEQVFLNYGRKPNSHFMQYYGFAIPRNPEEVARLRTAPAISREEWDASPRVIAADEKEVALLGHLSQIPVQGGSWVGWGEASEALVDAFRLLVADDDDFTGPLGGEWGAALGRGVISEANERRAASRLAARLRFEVGLLSPRRAREGTAGDYVRERLGLLEAAAAKLEGWAAGAGTGHMGACLLGPSPGP